MKPYKREESSCHERVDRLEISTGLWLDATQPVVCHAEASDTVLWSASSLCCGQSDSMLRRACGSIILNLAKYLSSFLIVFNPQHFRERIFSLAGADRKCQLQSQSCSNSFFCHLVAVQQTAKATSTYYLPVKLMNMLADRATQAFIWSCVFFVTLQL